VLSRRWQISIVQVRPAITNLPPMNVTGRNKRDLAMMLMIRCVWMEAHLLYSIRFIAAATKLALKKSWRRLRGRRNICSCQFHRIWFLTAKVFLLNDCCQNAVRTWCNTAKDTKACVTVCRSVLQCVVAIFVENASVAQPWTLFTDTPRIDNMFSFTIYRIRNKHLPSAKLRVASSERSIK